MTLTRLVVAAVLAMSAVAMATDGATDETVPAPRDTQAASVVRGGIVYRTYCVLCHGAEGRGDGRAAKMYTPKPANLTESPFNDVYKELIIRRGGTGVGRSAYMPPWGDELSDEQIHDLVSFLRELRKTGQPAG